MSEYLVLCCELFLPQNICQGWLVVCCQHFSLWYFCQIDLPRLNELLRRVLRENRKELQSKRKLPGAFIILIMLITDSVVVIMKWHDHGIMLRSVKVIMEIMTIQRVVRGQLERAQQGLEAAARLVFAWLDFLWNFCQAWWPAGCEDTRHCEPETGDLSKGRDDQELSGETSQAFQQSSMH